MDLIYFLLTGMGMAAIIAIIVEHIGNKF